MCNYDSHLLSGRCMHFLEKMTGWTWLFVSLRLASVPWFQVGVENTAILNHPVEMVRWSSAQSSTWPGTLHSWGSSGWGKCIEQVALGAEAATQATPGPCGCVAQWLPGNRFCKETTRSLSCREGGARAGKPVGRFGVIL